MTQEEITKYLAAGFIAIIFWFLRREITKVGIDLANKADKEQTRADRESMQREVERLTMELKETRDRRDTDMERLERTNSEKFAEFTASVRDRLGTMERNVDAKLDMILTVVKQLSKE